MWRIAPLTVIVALSLACGDDPQLPPAAGPWRPGVVAFRDATATWGLEAIGALGIRLSAVDVDGDGWCDLVTRRAGNGLDDFAGTTRHKWLLINQQGETFTDRTEASGLFALRGAATARRGRPGQIVAFADVDNDGDLDAFTGLSTANPAAVEGETSELMLNQGGGTFTFAAADNPLRRVGEVDEPAAAVFTDVDLDGRVDLFVPQHNATLPSGAVTFMQDRLWRGGGNGRFDDLTTAAGLRTDDWISITTINDGRAHTRAWGGVACDLNGDGLPELLVASYGRSPNHLWQANGGPGQPSYLNRSVASGYAYDDDLTWQDNQFALCYCRSNPSAEGCAGLPAPSMGCSMQNWDHASDREPFRLGGNSASTTCADLDNDGDLDLVTGEIKHWWAGSGADGSEILVNSGAADVRFTRPGDAATGLMIAHDSGDWDEGHMTQAVFDFDNDGWPDLFQGASDYPSNHGRLYQQAAPLAFVEVPLADGIDHHRTHGIAVADFDRDGDLDVAVGHSRARCDANSPDDCYATEQVRLFENLYGNRNRWLQLALIGGPNSNRAAIGARVTVTAGGRSQTQEVGGGFGHYGAQHDLVLHFGLADADEAEVTVRWPNGFLLSERFTLTANQRYRVEQGGKPRRVPR